MGNRCRILSFELSVTIALLITLSAAKPCDMDKDVCEYKFVVGYELTMVKKYDQFKAVNGSLHPVDVANTSAAKLAAIDDVITMDGYPDPRLVVAINGKIPGPAIEAYIGQTLVVHVLNNLFSSDVTVHWHGLHQKGTPFMDGVPFTTQCPIGPSQTFTYRFNLTQTGTYWYHSHSGTQRAMGLYGALIIREKKKMTIPEYLMVISDHNNHYDSNTFVVNILHHKRSFEKFHSSIVNGKGRFYDEKGNHNDAPLAKFTVKHGYQYRFRVISASASTAFNVSIDGHEMQIVASDGNELEPRTVDAFTIFPGERYDFIITANQKIGNYWIRGGYPEKSKNLTFESILHYEGAPDEEPNSQPKKCSQNNPCLVINCGVSKSHRNCITLAEINSSYDHEVPPIVPGKWKEHFLNFAFPGPPEYTPSSINGRVFKAPSVNPLYQPNEVDSLCDKQNCGTDRLCTCTHSLKLNKDETVQMVFLNIGNGSSADHPIHMHGHSFSVLKMVYPTLDANGVIISTPDISCGGNPKYNYCNDASWSNPSWGGDNIPGIKLKKAPQKDTINIPVGGYAVIRFKADNPGLWFMHCHIVEHNLDGMAMMLNESFADVAKAPDNFPVCRSFTPEALSLIPTKAETRCEIIKQEADSTDKDLAYTIIAVFGSVTIFLALVILVLVRRQYPSQPQPSKNAVEFSAYVNKGALAD